MRAVYDEFTTLGTLCMAHLDSIRGVLGARRVGGGLKEGNGEGQKEVLPELVLIKDMQMSVRYFKKGVLVAICEVEGAKQVDSVQPYQRRPTRRNKLESFLPRLNSSISIHSNSNHLLISV